MKDTVIEFFGLLKSFWQFNAEIMKKVSHSSAPIASDHQKSRTVNCKDAKAIFSFYDPLTAARERANCNSTDSRRPSIRQPTANPSRIHLRACIFCEKDKYTRNSRTREDKIKCAAMRADETIRKAAVGKMIRESWMSPLESLWLLKRATISHAVVVNPKYPYQW